MCLCSSVPLSSTPTVVIAPSQGAQNGNSPTHRLKKLFKKKIENLEPLSPFEFYFLLGVSGFLVISGGIFAGLTIGLMSLDSTNISILKASGSLKEKAYAERIEPIRKNTHLLLVTLLLGNTIVNESLPVLFHALHLDGYQAVLISTALIVIFGEIIPQAVCVRYGLRIGAFFAWPVRILIWLLFFIAWPIAKLLDWVLGHSEGVVYRRAGSIIQFLIFLTLKN
jgi:metal transporter CNNM